MKKLRNSKPAEDSVLQTGHVMPSLTWPKLCEHGKDRPVRELHPAMGGQHFCSSEEILEVSEV